MRLKEEKLLIIIGIISVIIIFCAIIIQISDSRIHNFENTLRTKELLNLHYHSVARQSQLNVIYYGLAASDSIPVSVKEQEITNNFERNRNDYRNYSHIAKLYADEINFLRDNNSYWFTIKNVFVVFQIFFILLNILLYFYLFDMIHKKT